MKPYFTIKFGVVSMSGPKTSRCPVTLRWRAFMAPQRESLVCTADVRDRNGALRTFSVDASTREVKALPCSADV